METENFCYLIKSLAPQINCDRVTLLNFLDEYAKDDRSTFEEVKNEVVAKITSKNVIMVLGGNSPCFVEFYDWFNNEWKEFPEIQDPVGFLRKNFAAGALGKKIFISGGHSPNNRQTNDISCLDLEGGQFVHVCKMQMPREGHAMIKVSPNEFAFVGGQFFGIPREIGIHLEKFNSLKSNSTRIFKNSGGFELYANRGSFDGDIKIMATVEFR